MDCAIGRTSPPLEVVGGVCDDALTLVTAPRMLGLRDKSEEQLISRRGRGVGALPATMNATQTDGVLLWVLIKKEFRYFAWRRVPVANGM